MMARMPSRIDDVDVDLPGSGGSPGERLVSFGAPLR